MQYDIFNVSTQLYLTFRIFSMNIFGICRYSLNLAPVKFKNQLNLCKCGFQFSNRSRLMRMEKSLMRNLKRSVVDRQLRPVHWLQNGWRGKRYGSNLIFLTSFLKIFPLSMKYWYLLLSRMYIFIEYFVIIVVNRGWDHHEFTDRQRALFAARQASLFKYVRWTLISFHFIAHYLTLHSCLIYLQPQTFFSRKFLLDSILLWL